MQPCLDDIRRLRPDLGFALYAMTPGGVVTFEVHHEGKVYTFKGATEAAVILEAFPPQPAPPPLAEPPKPDTSIFD